MPNFSKRSLTNLSQCHPDLQKIAHEAIKEFDFVVICGHRNKADQEEAFRKGASKVHWPNSMHNKKPSLAFDAYPYPIPKKVADWDTPEYLAKFAQMRSVFKAVARRLGINVRTIGWDKPHLELA